MFSKLGSAHRTASRATPPVPEVSGTSTMSGGEYPLPRCHLDASVIGMPPG